MSDIDTGVVVSLKVLDPDGRLEKRTNSKTSQEVRFVPSSGMAGLLFDRLIGATEAAAL